MYAKHRCTEEIPLTGLREILIANMNVGHSWCFHAQYTSVCDLFSGHALQKYMLNIRLDTLKWALY